LFEFLDVFVRAIQERDNVVDQDAVDGGQYGHPEKICADPGAVEISGLGDGCADHVERKEAAADDRQAHRHPHEPVCFPTGSEEDSNEAKHETDAEDNFAHDQRSGRQIDLPQPTMLHLKRKEHLMYSISEETQTQTQRQGRERSLHSFNHIHQTTSESDSPENVMIRLQRLHGLHDFILLILIQRLLLLQQRRQSFLQKLPLLHLY